MWAIRRWILLSCLTWLVESAVLDPALYLFPSPPLISSNGISPGDLWSQPLTSRHERDTDNLLNLPSDSKQTTTTEGKETINTAETFWPSLRPTAYSLRGIHVPVTFSITGSYGTNFGGYNPGVIASSYGSVSSDASRGMFGSYGKSALAGSSYGTFASGYPGVRIFGGSGKSGWSGWGNGKWGHYGKG